MIADDWKNEGQERRRNRRKSSSSCGMLRMSKPKEPPLILPGVIAEQSNNLANSVTISFSLTNAALSYSGLPQTFVGLMILHHCTGGSGQRDYQIHVAARPP
jgi:hypothetical protein